MRLVSRLIALYVSILLYFGSFSALASTNQCDLFSENVVTLKMGPLTLWEEYYSFNFQNFRRILFLGNGDKGSRTEKTNSTQLIVSSDINQYLGVNVRLDNNHLPFRENSFDLIYMNRGLCNCRESLKACGDIDVHKEPMKKFLVGAIAAFDKNSENSVAIFTGYYFFPAHTRAEIAANWTSTLNELRKEFPNLQFALLKYKTFLGNFEFMGLAISTGSQPIRDSINQIHPQLIDGPP